MATKLMKSPVETSTLVRASVNAVSEQAEPAIRSCTGAAACDKTSTLALIDKATGSLDAAFMTFDDSTMVLTVQPTVYTQIGTYTLEMTQTVQTGHAPIVMDVIVITVDCIIEQINTPTVPSPNPVVYNLMAANHFENIAPNFAQYPPCNYAIVESIAWTIPAIPDDTDAITAASDYQISVQSNTLSIHGQYTLVMTNTVTYTDRGTAQAWSPSITFVVDIKDPCKTSTISTVSLTDMSVVLGESTTQNFAEAVDSAETTYGLDSCGLRSYTIVLQSDATLTPVAFARVENINNANTNYKIISDYTDETYEGTHALALYITMVNYPVGADGAHPKLLSNFNLVISPAVCDCKLLDWIYPTA